MFVPGKLPAHTYNPRASRALEQQLTSYLEEGGAILTIAGPTKTGKSVLVKTVIENTVFVDGQGIEDVDELWARMADQLGVFTSIQFEAGDERTTEGQISSEAGIAFVKVAARGSLSGTQSRASTYGAERPLSAVVGESLSVSGRPLVIDDFHFISRPAQRQVVRALKPLVLAGAPVIFISISHRAQDVVTAEPDMTGRVTSMDVDTWNEDELLVIAEKGFELLNIEDPGFSISKRLARESYGSPHLMQKFCREISKENLVFEAPLERFTLLPPPNWDEFFGKQIDAASADWFTRLLRGPQKGGKPRSIWSMKNGASLDGYGLTLAAISSTGPKLALSKDEIKTAVDSLVDGATPALHQTTRVLQHMSNIAAKRATDPLPTEDEMDAQASEPQSIPDVQPVLEYMEQGPTSALHIADPFFAFYLKWGSKAHLSSGPAI